MTIFLRPLIALPIAVIAAFAATVQAQAPALIVETNYPGANAQVVADTIAAPIEQQIMGVEKLRHMVSRSTQDGHYTLTLTFERGADLDKAQVIVQNRVALAQPILPELVQREGVTVKKKSPGLLLLACLVAPESRYDSLYMSNYASIQIKDELARLPGIAEVVLFGTADYAMRIWVDPEKLAARALTAADVVKVLREQNLDTAMAPIDKKVIRTIEVKPLGRLIDPEQLRDLVLKSTNGQVVRLKDVAQVELGTGTKDAYARSDGKPAVVLGVYPLPQAKPGDVSARVRDKLATLQKNFPNGLALGPVFDWAPNWENANGPRSAEYLVVDVTLPAAASSERVRAVLDRSEASLRKLQDVESVLALSDQPFDALPGHACIIMRLASRADERLAPDVIQRLRGQLAEEKAAVFRLRGLSRPNAFPRGAYPLTFAVHGSEANVVRQFADKFVEQLKRSPKLTDVLDDSDTWQRPMLSFDIDRERAAALGVKVDDIASTLQTYYGTTALSNRGTGRRWQVIIEVGAAHRRTPEELKQLKVRNATGEMVPLGTVVSVREMSGPAAIVRLNNEPMVEVTANPASGVSLREARALCERIARELSLPAGYRITALE